MSITSVSPPLIHAAVESPVVALTLEYGMCNMETGLDTVDISDSSYFKRLVSGEPVQVRAIFGSPYAMTSTIKLWFNSNSIPRFKHGTSAELRRVRFLNFTNKIADKDNDVTLKARLKAEPNGLLAFMVAGLQAILQGVRAPEGGPASVRVKARFSISNDPVAAFVKECVVFDKAKHLFKDELWDAFGSYLSSWGFAEKTKAHFFGMFYDRDPSVVAYRLKNASTWPDGTTKAAGHWLRGLSLGDPAKEPTD